MVLPLPWDTASLEALWKPCMPPPVERLPAGPVCDGGHKEIGFFVLRSSFLACDLPFLNLSRIPQSGRGIPTIFQLLRVSQETAIQSGQTGGRAVRWAPFGHKRSITQASVFRLAVRTRPLLSPFAASLSLKMEPYWELFRY